MINFLPNKSTVLVLGPHPDDEIGCAGLVVRLLESGHDVYHYYFSDCHESLEKINYTTNQLQLECNNSRTILGLEQKNCNNFNFPVRYFNDHRQDILEKLVQLRQELSPSLVLVPNSKDIHQDHQVIHNESVRAFKHSSILGYELPWNMLSCDYDCFIGISEQVMQKKIEALESYKTQALRLYANKIFFESLANIRGVQANVKFAECYEVIRLIIN